MKPLHLLDSICIIEIRDQSPMRMLYGNYFPKPTRPHVFIIRHLFSKDYIHRDSFQGEIMPVNSRYGMPWVVPSTFIQTTLQKEPLPAANHNLLKAWNWT